MAPLPRLILIVGAVSLVIGGMAIGGGIYREATFECDDTLSLNPGVDGRAKADGTAAFADLTIEERHGGGQHRVAAVEEVCAPESTPRLASLLKRGGIGLALGGAGLAVGVLLRERSDRLRALLR